STAATAEPVLPAPRRALNARARIVAWMMLAVAVAPAANFLISTRVLFSRVDANMTEDLEQQASTMRKFAASSTDPLKGRPFTRVDALFDSYLIANLPSDQEAFFYVVDNKLGKRGPGTPPVRLDADPAFVANVIQ